jgi:hypothetical protein
MECISALVPTALINFLVIVPSYLLRQILTPFYLSDSRAVRPFTLVDLWASPLDQSSIHFTLATMG